MEEIKKSNLTFEQANTMLDGYMLGIKNNFIGTGYVLKRVRDEKLFLEAGYRSFDEFVDAKYGKDKTWASKCIKVSAMFGQSEDNPVIQDKYKDYEFNKLVELASLSSEQREQVTPDMKVQEIRELKPKRKKKVATVATVEPEIQKAVAEEPNLRKLVTREQKPQKVAAEPDKDSCPPGITDCCREEWGTTPEAQATGRKECNKCWETWKHRQPTEPEIIEAEFEEVQPDPKPYCKVDVLLEMERQKDKLESSRPDGKIPSDMAFLKASMLYDALKMLFVSIGGREPNDDTFRKKRK